MAATTGRARGVRAHVGGSPFVALSAPFASIDELKGYGKDVRDSLGSGIIALVMDDDAPQLWVTVSDDLVTTGVSAGDLVAAAMPALHGRGGGRPQMAQGKGTERSGIPEALAAIEAHLGR